MSGQRTARRLGGLFFSRFCFAAQEYFRQNRHATQAVFEFGFEFEFGLDFELDFESKFELF